MAAKKSDGKIGFLKSFGTKMVAKKSDFLENRISQISVPPKNENQEIRFFGKIGFRGGLDISAFLH
jgi:hypothetical protein